MSIDSAVIAYVAYVQSAAAIAFVGALTHEDNHSLLEVPVGLDRQRTMSSCRWFDVGTQTKKTYCGGGMPIYQLLSTCTSDLLAMRARLPAGASS